MGVAKGRRAVRTAWSHVLFPVESAESGKPFDLDHLAITARERCSVPAAVYDKASAKGDGIVREALGGETLATRLTELWPADRPHLPVAEIADWFATFVYLQKLRDRVVLETAIRGALAKLDAKFAYAEGFDEPSGNYAWLLWQKAPIGPMPPTALLVRPEVAMAQLRTVSMVFAIVASVVAIASGFILFLLFEAPLLASIFLASALIAIGCFLLAGIAAYFGP